MLTRALLATLVTAVVTAVSVTPFQSGASAARQSPPLLPFDISATPSGATIVGARLVLDQCATGGTPFPGSAHVIGDHLSDATAPDSATLDATPAPASVG